MRIGSPFNPYKVFQGVFAPYWILEHRGIGSGAKLCYIRLLGFAGKDARCYPSLETLGKSLGVSDRQARDYVKELERAGFIAAEQRGLRRTNVYFFLWTAELENLTRSVPDELVDSVECPKGSTEPPEDRNSPSGLDRNNRSGQDRNTSSAPDRNRSSVPDRNRSSGLDRKRPAGPIGINSVGISSQESSSSDSSTSPTQATRGKTKTSDEPPPTTAERKDDLPDSTDGTEQTIIGWAKARKIQRLRSDRQVGPPEQSHLAQWTSMFAARGVADEVTVHSVLDEARAAADRCGQWHSWGFLTLQIQLAAERIQKDCPLPPVETRLPQETIPEDKNSDWAKAKTRIRRQISEIAFVNWFAGTWQIENCGSRIAVGVPDEATKLWVESEYAAVINGALSDLGIEEVRFVVCAPPIRSLELDRCSGSA